MVVRHTSDNLGLQKVTSYGLRTGVCHVNQQSGECKGEVSSFRSRCYRNHIQPKSKPRARQTRSFIGWRHAHAWQGTRDTGTSP